MNATRTTIALTLCAAMALPLAGCGGRGGGPPGGGAGGFAFPVAAAPITRGNIDDYVSVTSTVVPKLQAQLSSVVSGTVISVGGQVGERVHQGELLVQIDDSTLRAQQSQQAANLALVRANTSGGTTTAQANLRSAKTAYETSALNFKRNEQLYSQGYVSQSALDDSRNRAQADKAAYESAEVTAQNASLTGDDTAAQAALSNAEASLAFVQRQIAQSHVTAPFDGVIVARNVDPGSLAAPGTTLMEVAQLDPVYVDAGISGDDLSYVHVGTPVLVNVGGTSRTWGGKVAFLNQSASPGTLIYLARIPLANPDLTLRGGMVATVQFARARKTGVLLAPRASVYQTPAGYSMFVIDEKGLAKEVPVEVGIINDQQAEVTGEGLKAGVMAILNHSALLQPGTPVQVIPPPGAGTRGAAGPGGAAKPAASKPASSKPGASKPAQPGTPKGGSGY